MVNAQREDKLYFGDLESSRVVKKNTAAVTRGSVPRARCIEVALNWWTGRRDAGLRWWQVLGNSLLYVWNSVDWRGALPSGWLVVIPFSPEPARKCVCSRCFDVGSVIIALVLYYVLTPSPLFSAIPFGV